MGYLTGYLAGFPPLYGANGNQLTSAAAVRAAMAAGVPITDSSGFMYDNGPNPGSVISTGGGDWLFKGCPLSVIFGAAMTLAQAQAVVNSAPILNAKGYTSCLAQAQQMVSGSSSPSGVTAITATTSYPPTTQGSQGALQWVASGPPSGGPTDMPPIPLPPTMAPDNTMLYVGLGLAALFLLKR